MKLTKEEKQIILNKRKEEDLNKSKKIGYLKEDLWKIPKREINYLIRECEFYSDYLTEEGKNLFIQNIKDCFQKPALKSGAEFDCFINADGSEEWHDRKIGMITSDLDWVNQYLINIKKI